MAAGHRDAVDLRVAGLELETHPLVERDRDRDGRQRTVSSRGARSAPISSWTWRE
jgi:hypothetical protein